MNRRDACSTIDWNALVRLREAFLTGGSDYWTCETDLDSYDQTFAQRIGWKWDFVLAELKSRGWTSPAGTVVDWGCGTGIASRKFLEYFPGASRLYLCDRSPLAMEFAAKRSSVPVWKESSPPGAADVLLISHALTEQPEGFALPCEAQSVIVVEPGTHEASQKLIALRERVRERYAVIAPCTHSAACGLQGSRHWCHHFAPVPNEVFRSADWARFGKVTGIDLRSLPVSFLVLDKRSLPVTGVRLIGAPRIYKGYALALVCDAAGVQECRLTKRRLPEWFRRWRKGEAPGRVELKREGSEIVEMKIP
jgi:SAM-dependent methyltransferase